MPKRASCKEPPSCQLNLHYKTGDLLFEIESTKRTGLGVEGGVGGITRTYVNIVVNILHAYINIRHTTSIHRA